MTIGDVFLRLLSDSTGFQADVEKKAGPAADKAGTSLGKRLSKNMGRVVAGGIGTILGAGFSIAAKGAADLDAATQQLVANTGLTGKAADEAKGQLAGLYKNNLQGYAEIGDALSKVHTDLGLTGDAAKTAAQASLSYATATKQDAGTVVGAFDDILDSYNMAATDAPKVMDMLIASHQKYGGDIAGNQDALAKLAPAMNAAGFSIEDSVGLLDLFNAAGVDASKIPQAMNTALKKVKSPKELKDLIKQIADTKDPFKRAAEATKLFGTRAGPQLAQALAQGNLDDFTVSMDEARGATDKAADAVKSGWGNQFQLILKNAGGTLAEFGSNFGPLLMVGAQIGPKLGTAIATAVGGLASVVPGGIKAALGKLGSMLGLKVATTMGAEIAGEAGAKAIAGGVTAAGSSAAVTTAAGGIGGLIASGLMAALTIALVAGLGVAIALALDKAFPGLAKNLHDWFFRGLDALTGALTGHPLTPDLYYKSPAPGAPAAPGHGATGPGPTVHTPTVNPATGFVTSPRLAGGMPYVPTVMPAILDRGEAVLTAAQADAWRGGGTTNITVPITGLVRARDPFEIATQLKRLSDFGVLTPRREPA